MGIYVQKEQDPELFKSIIEEVDRLLKISDEIRITVEKVEGNKTIEREELQKGYCIRTGVKIPFDPDKPFSKEAYHTWNQYSDSDFKEEFCHFSGESSNGETRFAKPILGKNWKNAKEIFKFEYVRIKRIGLAKSLKFIIKITLY